MSRWKNREEFRARVRDWAGKLDVPATVIYVRPMRRKWASCSTAGTLSFNDELLSLDPKLGDYVIVHELLHFSVPNHGKLWKSLMRAQLGGLRNGRKGIESSQIHNLKWQSLKGAFR